MLFSAPDPSPDNEPAPGRAQPTSGRGAGALSCSRVLDSGDTPAPRPFRRRDVRRVGTSPAGAQGTRPAAKPLPTAGRAASDSLLQEVEALLAGSGVRERGTRRIRVRPFARHRQG